MRFKTKRHYKYEVNFELVFDRTRDEVEELPSYTKEDIEDCVYDDWIGHASVKKLKIRKIK